PRRRRRSAGAQARGLPGQRARLERRRQAACIRNRRRYRWHHRARLISSARTAAGFREGTVSHARHARCVFRVPIVNVRQPRSEHSVLTHHTVLTHRNMASTARSSTRIRLLAGVVAALLVTGAPVAGFMITPAHAQASISVQFRTALQDHGRWQRHSRWGEVWVPAGVQRDWRPYTRGHWVYTDDWGWYWVEDDAEASWGWVTNHYGRWVYDEELAWCWVPGEEWGPAWVQWRQSNDDVVGWAALPPDDVVVEYRESPRFWVFVRTRDFIAPRVANV